MSAETVDQANLGNVDRETDAMDASEMDTHPTPDRRQLLASMARERSYNPPVDLRLLDYVAPYDSNLMCPICRCPFVDPIALVECGHCFCRDCIRQAWDMSSSFIPLRSRGTCPTCRTSAKPEPRSATSKILVNMTDDLVVKCPKTEYGCQAHVKRGEVQDHVTIYCGYAMVECAAEDCELPVLRKDAKENCLHYDVSCLACRKQMQRWKLEVHWRAECPERVVQCHLCDSTISSRDFQEHMTSTCPEAEIACPGSLLGCNERGKKPQADGHAKTCILAKMAPTVQMQQKKLEEQETAQKQMARKLGVLQNGLATMQSILYPSPKDGNHAAETPHSRSASPVSDRGNTFDAATSVRPGPDNLQYSLRASGQPDDLGIAAYPQGSSIRTPIIGSAPAAPGPRPGDLPESFTSDFDLEAPASFPPPDTNGGPYASPLHHLLSMHESLRDEISRISSALSELDGRHSMQNLNENLRTREEISYLGAQVGGLQRQVHWLTSTQLQRQHVGRSPTPGSAAAAGAAISDAAAGAGVEAAVSAVNTAATALRGAAGMVSGGSREGIGLRRGPSEEGRTKL